MANKPAAAKIDRVTRSTGMGAYNNTRLYSIRQEKELQPQQQHSSRTGNHGEKTWFLLPGRYWEATISRSNSGKGGWRVGILTISKDLSQKFEIAEPPEWLKKLLPEGAIQPTPYE